MRARTLIGLDVGSRFIKALQLSELKGRMTITQYAQSEVPPGLSPADAVAELFTRRKFAGKRVVSAVSGKDVFVRFLSMAAADRDEMRTAAKYEIGKFIPVETDQVIHDSYTIEEGEIGADSRVVLAAARRTLIDEQVEMLETAGLQPAIIDVTAFALGNAYSLAGFVHPDAIYPGKVVALVDVGATRTTLHILRDEISFFTREIYKGSEDLAAAEVARETSVQRREEEPGGTRVMENPSTKSPIIIVGDDDASKVRRRGGTDTETMPILMVSAEDAAKLKPIPMEGGGGDVPIVIVPEEDATKLRRSSEETPTQSLPIIIVPTEDATKLRRRGDDTSSVKIPILIIDPEDATKLRRIEMEVREAGSMPHGAPVHELCNEILVSVEYFEAQHDLKVDQLLLTGGGSLFPELVENLQEVAKRPVAKWNAIERMDQDLAEAAHTELEKFNAQAAIAFGLAARIRPD